MSSRALCPGPTCPLVLRCRIARRCRRHFSRNCSPLDQWGPAMNAGMTRWVLGARLLETRVRDAKYVSVGRMRFANCTRASRHAPYGNTASGNGAWRGECSAQLFSPKASSLPVGRVEVALRGIGVARGFGRPKPKATTHSVGVREGSNATDAGKSQAALHPTHDLRCSRHAMELKNAN